MIFNYSSDSSESVGFSGSSFSTSPDSGDCVGLGDGVVSGSVVGVGSGVGVGTGVGCTVCSKEPHSLQVG